MPILSHYISSNITKLFLGALVFIILSSSSSQFSRLNTYSFEAVDSLQRINPKPVVVFIHTDWCKYCEAMRRSTFMDDGLQTLLNDSTWYITLNAESKQDITFHGRTFKHKSSGANTGTHELAEQLGAIDGKLSYPSVCILNSEYEIVFQYNQFLSAQDFTLVLNKLFAKD